MSLQIVQNQQLKPIGDKVPIDTTLSSSSENAISNKAVNDEITRINSDLSDFTTVCVVNIASSTSQDVTVSSLSKLATRFKFISLEMQLNADGKNYIQSSTTLPLRVFVSSAKRVIRTSFNNGTYFWCGANYKDDTTITINNGSGMTGYVAIIRVFN